MLAGGLGRKKNACDHTATPAFQTTQPSPPEDQTLADPGDTEDVGLIPE